ncbi:MAG: glucokinase [Dissulfurimicrobium hydrothermale]|uniref:glucokinase n=1 Tax=Dissulfurimicrobium hydrothermale TaxID=1750598 RepID=UPI003C716E52
MLILAGDIGGTNGRLAIFRDDIILFERSYPSTAVGSLAQCLTAFLRDAESILGPIKIKIKGACLAVAGVVDKEKGEASTINLPWTITSLEMSHILNIPNQMVMLINDIEAAAFGVMSLGSHQMVKIGGLEATDRGPKAVIGAGTGLGEALIVPLDDMRFKILATEGGHVDFAPNSPIEIELLESLAKKFGHVSVERVLSGPGLMNIYGFLANKNGVNPSYHNPAEITASAMANKDGLCTRALEIFCSIYGAEAGNLALKCLASGGVYITGGIAPAILPFLIRSDFRKTFETKGRLTWLLQKIPVFVVMEQKLGLIGAQRAIREYPLPI